MDPIEDRKSLRQRQLLKQLEVQRHMTLDEIAEHFFVTTQTARRDVMELEQLGHLRRIHGGAMVIDRIGTGALRNRRVTNSVAKDRVAAAVAAEVADGMSIFLDTGTTCEAIAHALVCRQNLRVVTYSLRIANFLCDSTDFVLALPGGFVRQVDGAVFQETTAAFLGGFRFDLAILSVTGIEEGGQLTDDDPAEVSVVRAAMAQAHSILLAADHSKFGNRGLVRMGTLSEIACLVTDREPPKAIVQRLEQHGGRVVVG